MKQEELVNRLKTLLSSTFAFYLKCHYYHWNVEGKDFPQYHDFFGKLYEEVYGSIDEIAEHIRTLDSYAPGSLGRFKELSNITDETTVPSAVIMCQRLLKDNDIIIQDLTFAYTEAEKVKEIGLENYLQDRIDIHKKHGWMLRSCIKA
jgi:starvation-inducible DNA-binding protein